MEFVVSVVAATLEAGTEVLVIAVIAFLAFLLALFILPTIYQYLYSVLDAHNERVTTSGKVIDKRHVPDHWFVQVEMCHVIRTVKLPRTLYEAIEVGDNINLSVLRGKFSGRFLSIEPAIPRIDTYA